MPEILIEPQNPLDMRPEQLGDLVDALRAIDPANEVKFAYHDQRGYGVTFWEVIFIWVGQEIAKGTVKEIIRVAADWAKQRFNLPEKGHRPKSVTILGPNGKAISHVTLDPKTREGVEGPLEEENASRRKKPPIRD